MNRNTLTLFLVSILTLISITVHAQTPRVRYFIQFDKTGPLGSWSTKNNTFPPSAAKADWAISGPGTGYLGLPHDAPTDAWSLFMRGISKAAEVYAGASTENIEYMRYDYATVGLSEYDYDDAYISKWLVTPTMELKNGDQIKFYTKEKFRGAADGALDVALGNLDGALICNRANRLEVRMSLQDEKLRVGNKPGDNGDFTHLLVTINDGLQTNGLEVNQLIQGKGYPTEWTEITITISGLPEGKLVRGNIAFVYRFQHGGLNNCGEPLELPEPVEMGLGGLDEVLGAMELPGPSIGALLFGAKVFSIAANASNDDNGTNGTYIAIDDFKHTTFSKTTVINYDSGFVWYEGRGPTKPIKLAYRGSPDCYSDGMKSETRFTLENNSDDPLTFYPSLLGDARLIFNAGIGTDTLGPITVAPKSTKTIFVKLKPDLALTAGIPGKATLEIKVGSETHTIKLSYEILPPAPPIARCQSYPINLTLNSLGIARLENGKQYDGGSEAEGDCPSAPLKFEFSLPVNGTNTGYHSAIDLGCANVGKNLVYLIVSNAGQASYCPLTVNVEKPASFHGFTSTPQIYYTPKWGNGTVPLVLDSLQKPKSNGTCPVKYTVQSIKRVGDTVTNYLSSPSLSTGEYLVNWKLKVSDWEISYYNSQLNIVDTVKPIANCKDTTKIGFNQIKRPGQRTQRVRDAIWAYGDVSYGSNDNSDLGSDKRGITKFSIASQWYTPGFTFFTDSFEIQCSNIGLTFPVTLKVYDASGNFGTCETVVQIIDPSKPECKNISLELSPTTGTKILTANELLLNGGSGACGMTNLTVSKSSFTCADTNKTYLVTAGYTDPNGVVRGCSSSVTVKSYSVPEGSCQDTVKTYLTNFSTATVELQPLLVSKCSPQKPWSLSISNYDFPTITGTKVWNFDPGYTEVIRRAILLNDTFTCKQVYAVFDTLAPIVSNPVSNQSIALPNLGNECFRLQEIPNPFQQLTYSKWTYTLSGATNKTVEIVTTDYNYRNTYWLNQWDSINPGITTVTLTAEDLAGNKTTRSYTINLTVSSLPTPRVAAYKGAGIGFTRLVKEYCGSIYKHYIPSPMEVPCGKTDYMWYFEVRDRNTNDLLFERDSIPQISGADIPLKISAYEDEVYYKVIFGYHEKTYGDKMFSTSEYISVLDTFSNVMIPQNVIVESNNNTTYTYDYAIPSPMKYGGSCSGGYWGYKVTGATQLQTSYNPSITYSANQTTTLSASGSYYASGRYPVIPADSSALVQLNIGNNTIEYFIIEESGNGFNSFVSRSYTYNVLVNDISFPQMTCPSNDTIHRSSGSCRINVVNAAAQVIGFTGAFGKDRIAKMGGNAQVALNKFNDSVVFVSKVTKGSEMDAYIVLEFNCSGTVSFNWEYKSSTPSFYRPFIVGNNFNPSSYNQPAISGFNQSNSGIQTGTFSQAVVAGDRLYIGMNEGGYTNGYFKITNLSAPHAYPSAVISQPVYANKKELFYHNDFETSYPIGVHTITHTLTNVNNLNSVTCAQKLVIIDDFATTLSCTNDTLYLNENGQAEIKLNEVLQASCFPVSSTTLSKRDLTSRDIGTQNITILSINHLNDSVTCNFNITLYDTIAPVRRFSQIKLTLSPSNTATLSDSILKAYFYDNHKVVSVTANKTSFSNLDIGEQIITLTATDSSGNTNSVNATIEVTPGFAPNAENPIMVDACSRDSVVLSYDTKPGYTLNYQWQVKDTSNDIHWNYYTCNQSTRLLDGDNTLNFFRYKNESYYAFSNIGNSSIEFKKLDTITNNWRPALTAIPAASVLPFKVNILIDFRGTEQLQVAFISSTGGTFAIRQYEPFNNTWLVKQDGLYDFFTFPVSRPTTSNGPYGTNSRNFFIQNVFGNGDKFFTVNNQADIYAVSQDENGFTQSYYYIKDTIEDFGVQFPRKAYDINSSDPWVPNGSIPPTKISNGKQILAIRNTINQNLFFKLNLDSEGMIIGKDSLTTDPTDGSSLFEMESLNGNDYIAFKSLSGKITVKKYTGSNTWSIVGGVDFSTDQITKLDIKVIQNMLYVVYFETTGKLVVKKYDGSSWIAVGSPSDDITADVGYMLKLFNLNNTPAVYFASNSMPGGRIIRIDKWRNIVGATSKTYKPNLTTSSTAEVEYRCLATAPASFTISTSGIKKVSVTQTPTITMLIKQQNVVKGKTAQLELQTSGSEVKWQYGFTPGQPLLSSTPTLIMPEIDVDTQFYAYANNRGCYSDTVMAKVYVIDAKVAMYNVSVKDTVCTDDQVQISLDTALVGHKYSLYMKDNNGEFVYADNLVKIEHPSQQVAFEIYPEESNEYKIKIEKTYRDAMMFRLGNEGYQNVLNFGDTTLAISKSLTIESWVKPSWSMDPFYVFAIQYSGGDYWDTDPAIKNWEWSRRKFTVYNGSQQRSLDFPMLTNYNWVHVATTADSSGLKIYYNGALVASSNETSSAAINNNTASLLVGASSNRERTDYLEAMDEFRVWNTARNITQIANGKDACFTETEPGLLLYNTFTSFDFNSEKFLSTVGPDAQFSHFAINDGVQMERNLTCIPQAEEPLYTAPFTVTTLDNQPHLVYYDQYYSATTSSCMGEMVQLHATTFPGSHSVTWYNAPSGGDIVGVGNNLNVFLGKDTMLYPAVTNSVCQRGETYIDLNEFPTIEYAEVEPYCYGEELGENSFDIGGDYYDYKIYDDSLGGTPLDLDYGNGSAIDRNRMMTQTDTLWVEAYNVERPGEDEEEDGGSSQLVITCVSSNRVPLVLTVRPQNRIVLTLDSSRFGEGSLTLKAFADTNQFVQWFDINENFLNTWDTIYTTPDLSTTTQYLVRAGDNECEYSEYDTVTAIVNYYPTRNDTIVACESFTWEDGNTYTTSDSTISFTKQNASGLDSLIALNLTIIGFDESDIAVGKMYMCTGDSTTITIQNAQAGYHYMLVDTSTSAVVLGPVLGDGSSIVFNTGALTHSMGYNVMATDTAMVSNLRLGCTKQIGDVINLKVGLLYSSSELSTCGSYQWRGSTYTQSGIYYDTLLSTQGCDSIISIDLTIFSSPVYIDSVIACNSYTWHGITYYASTNTPTWNAGITEYGCDSTVTLHLTIRTSATVDTKVAWDSYSWINGTTYTASNNTATKTLTNMYGCDSIITLHLTIINTIARTSYNPQTICSGKIYTYNGHLYNTSGNFRDTINSASGRDSIIVTQLTVNPVYSVNNIKAICAGNSYMFNSHTYSTAGTYRDTLLTVNGCNCDSIIVTQLTVNPTYSINNAQTICSGKIYTFNGHNYSTSGTYRDTLHSVNGCDSIIVTQLTVNPVYNVNNPQTICSGKTYAFNSHNYTAAGTYRDTLQSINGCDSIIVTQLTVNPVYSVNNPQTICSGKTYAFNSHNYTASGTYRDTLHSVTGCDSIIVTQLTVNPVYSVNNPQTICSGKTYAFNSHNYTASGTYRDTLHSVNGCDSIIVTQLTVNPIYSVNNPQTICSGKTYAFNSHNYTASGTYRDTLHSVYGCDSIIVTQLTVNPVYSVNNSQTICSGKTYAFNSHNYTASGTYRDTLHSVNGCDSIIVTQLTVNPVYSVNNSQTICSGKTYAFNSHNYTASGTYRDTLHSVNGCDSIIVTQLTVNPVYSVNNPQTICSGKTYAFNSHNYTASGTYRDTLHSVNGCDSIIVTQLTVNPVYAVNNLQTICSGKTYAFNSHNYTAAGTYRDTLHSVNGCDSIIVTQLTVNPVYAVNNPQTICSGKTYAFNSHNYTASGTYRDTLHSVNGCDSIIVTQLTVNPVYAVNNLQTICSGKTYAFNSHNYTASGTYRDTLHSVNGCDSIIVTLLTVNPVYSVNNPQTICSGKTYAFNSHNYTAAGTYRDTLHSVNGCDSIIVTQLTVNPVYSVNNAQTICSGKTYAFNSHNYTASGTYRDTLHSVNGCDSIIVTQLTVNSVYSVNNPQTICSGKTYAFNSHNYTAAGTYRDTLHSVNGCDSIIVTQLTVNPTYTTSNPQTICNGRMYTFNGHNYTLAGNYRDTLHSVTGCDSIIVTQLTVNPKPTTSAITGQHNPLFNAIETYSVSNTAGSTYKWIITNGTQISGTNTNIITVQWNAVLTNSSVKVVETNGSSCLGDTVSQNISLPVNLISFEAVKNDQDIQLEWITAGERNNDYFMVQRSSDGKQFDNIGKVDGNGTTNALMNYQYVDKSAALILDNSTLYYRLKQTDMNGRFEYSKVVTINDNATVQDQSTLVVIPNPFINQAIVKINNPVREQALMRITDKNGKTVDEQYIELNIGNTIIELTQFADRIPSGVYILQVITSTRVLTERAIKTE